MERGLTISESPQDQDHNRVTIISLANVLLRHRRLLITIPALAVLAALTYKLLTPPAYIADSTFMPQTSGGSTSRLAGFAAQFGMSVSGGGNDSDNLQFYAELIKSRELLRDVATSAFTFEPASEPGVKYTGTLVQLYKPDAQTAEGRIRQVMGRLDEQVVATADPVVGIVTVVVTAPWPELAVLINARLLELVNDFNLRRLQSQARAEREFAEASLAKAQRELDNAGQALQQFLQQNRLYAGSPQLNFEMRRLQQRVDFQQQIATSLATSYAQSQLAEVRNTPVVTVIDRPEKSARRIPRGLIIAIVVASVLGVFVAAILAFALDYLRSQQQANPQDFEEFQQLKRSAVPSLGRRFRLLRLWRPAEK